MPFTNTGLLVIKNEITTDPVTVGYSGKTDDQVAGLLNLPRPLPVIQGPVAPSQIMLYLLEQNKISSFLSSTNTTVQALLAYLTRSQDRMIDPGPLTTLLAQLVTAAVLTAGDQTAILALSQHIPLRSRLQILFDTNVGVIETSDVAAARVAV